jgi:hypothetical protein
MKLAVWEELKVKLRRTWVHELFSYWRSWRDLAAWYARGRPDPPPSRFKQGLVKRTGRSCGFRTLVETGTYAGDMIAACLWKFDHIVSVELSPELAVAARERFRKFRHVEILEGDSGDLLPGVLDRLSEPALFWLDGHYSGGVTARGEEATPVRRELEAILRHKRLRHGVLIDDARAFTGAGDYPTLGQVRDLALRLRPEGVVTVLHDVIRIIPEERSDGKGGGVHKRV